MGLQPTTNELLLVLYDKLLFKQTATQLFNKVFSKLIDNENNLVAALKNCHSIILFCILGSHN